MRMTTDFYLFAGYLALTGAMLARPVQGTMIITFQPPTEVDSIDDNNDKINFVATTFVIPLPSRVIGGPFQAQDQIGNKFPGFRWVIIPSSVAELFSGDCYQLALKALGTSMSWNLTFEGTQPTSNAPAVTGPAHEEAYVVSKIHNCTLVP